MQGTVNIPNQFIQMIPYVLTMVVLAGWIGRARPPKALGIPYVKE
jgi:simple sugar transport system permease protein